MSLRIANTSITLVRRGKAVHVSPGQAIDLTKEEIQTFKELNPSAFRVPATNSVEVVGTDKVLVETEGGKEDSADEGKADANKGGKASGGKENEEL